MEGVWEIVDDYETESNEISYGPTSSNISRLWWGKLL